MVSPRTVTAEAGETVDQLCWRILGRTADVAEATLVLNPGLAALGATLPEGTLVTLPGDDAASAPRDIVQLWS